MREHPFSEDREEMKELLAQFELLKNGRSHSFIEEDAFIKLIEYFDEKEDNANALEAATLSVEQFPYSSALFLKKADILIGIRKYKEALLLLEQAELLDRNDINLYILKTDVYLALDQQQKAVEILEEGLVLFSGEERIDLLFELADVYDDYEDFEKVFDCLQIILEQDPANEEALYKICFWTDFTGRNEESIRLHLKIIDIQPYNELAWFNLASSYQGLKLYEKAVDAYLYAIAIDDKFDYAYRNLGDAYIRLRKYKDAIEALSRVLELSKPEEVIYEAIGHCYDKMHNYAQARFYYRKATHLNPEIGKLFYKIAYTYFNEQQWIPALKQLATAVKIHPKQPEYYLLMGECYLVLNKIKEAVQNFSISVTLRPKNIAGWEALIRCLYKASFYEEAEEQVIAALRITKGNTLFLFYQAAILFGFGKSKEALMTLEKAMERAPRLLKKFIALNPSIFQNQQVVDIIARHKRMKKF